MKNFFKTSFIILALIISAAGAAHAQTPTAEEQAIIDQQSQFGDDYGSDYQALYESTPEYKAAAGTQTPYKPDGAEDFFAPVMQQIMKLFAWLVGAAALTLDYSVYYTVVNMGSYVNDLAAVGVTWRILRDIGNIVIIFGFLGIGIAIILNVNWYGGGFKMLPMLLVAAVFLNFSLFLSEVVIDAGNLFATQIYTQIKGGQLPTAASLSGTTILDAIERDGISTKIMSQLGLTTIYGNAVRNPQVFAAGNSLLIGFMGIILFLVTAFVLFSLAFVLISRFVILLFLIIIAPIGFAGLAVPQLKNAANKWWDTLFQQTITAPILLLLLYIALAVITDVQFLTGLGIGKGRIDADWTGWVTNNNLAGFGGVMLSFLVAIGMLLYVVIASKKLSAFGAEWASKTAGKLTFGATAFGIRSTAGWGLQAASRKFSSSKWSRVPVIGRTFAGVLDRGAKGSFDVRGIKTLGGLKGGIGIDAGEVEKGGYRKTEEDAIKGREEYAKTLGPTPEEKKKIETEEALVKALQEETKTIKEGNEKEMNDLRDKHKTELKDFNDEIDKNRAELKTAQTSGDKERINRAQFALNTALLGSQQKRDEQNKERETLRGTHDQRVSGNRDDITSAKGRISEFTKAGQIKYAENLGRVPWGLLYRNEKAAANIKKNAGKSKEQEDVETMLNLVKKAAASAPSATPTPPPSPAGGAATP